MKQTQEFAGKNIDSAIKNACFELNVSKSDLKYDIISTGASGIFGIVGRKNAKIRVSLPEINPDANKHNDDDGGVQSIVDEAFGVKPKQNTKPSDTTNKNQPKKVIDKPSPSSPSDARQDSAKTSDPIQSDPKKVAKPKKQAEKIIEHEIVDVTKESIELGQEAVQKMINLITEDAKVSAESEKDRLLLKVSGGNSGILIGRKGQTLEAMQFLADKIVNRKSESRVRVKVDIEGYMEARKANLIQLANKMADKAKKTGRPATINQMSGQDRRIIHLALKEDPKVRTQSKGDGYYRRLIILPKRTGSFKEKTKHQQ